MLGVSKPASTTTSKPVRRAGAAVTLRGTRLYANSTTSSAAATKNGTYYLWDTRVTNGRIRITNKPSNAGVVSQITGWVNASDIGV